MAGAATEMLLRSMYVSRYIRLIKNRTIHRVFVALNAAFSEIALDVRTGGTLVSNNVSVTSGESIANLRNYACAAGSGAIARASLPIRRTTVLQNIDGPPFFGGYISRL